MMMMRDHVMMMMRGMMMISRMIRREMRRSRRDLMIRRDLNPRVNMIRNRCP